MRGLEWHKAGNGSGDSMAILAVRLAAVGADLAWSRAVAFLGGKQGEALSGMRAGAEHIIAEARK